MADKSKKIKIVFDQELHGDITVVSPTLVYREDKVAMAGKLTGSGYYSSSYTYDKVYDGNLNTYWRSGSTVDPQWLLVDLGAPSAIRRFRIYLYSYPPREFILQGSDDNVNFTDVLSGEFQNAYGWQEFTVVELMSFRYWRLYFASKWSSRYCVYELEMFTGTPLNNEGAFTVNAMEYDHIDGTLVPVEYQVQSVYPGDNAAEVILELNPLQRMRKPEGDITVNYDQAKGNLKSRYKAVESFSVSFTPVDLVKIPNPWDRNTIAAQISNYTIGIIEVTHKAGILNEHIAPSLVDYTIQCWPVDEAPV